MSSSLLFNIANVYAMPLWIAAILFPNWKVTKTLFNSYLPWIPLIVLYIYYVVVSFNTETSFSLLNFGLADVANFLSQENAAGSAWVHFLAVDLFLGRWIYWQGQEKNILTTHSLLLCLFFGPVGLLSHAITETLFGNRESENLDTPT